MFFSDKKDNLTLLLIKTLSLIKKSERKRFLYLIIFLIIQALLDVISIASIIPLLYLLENKEDLVYNLNNFFIKFGIDSDLIYDKSLTLYIPILVIGIMIISTVGRLFIIYKSNQFIEKTRHSISSRLMNIYIQNNYNYKKIKSDVAKSILSEVDQFIIIVFQPVVWMVTNIILLIGIIVYLFYTNLKASVVCITLLLLFYITFYLFSKKILNIQGIESENSNKGRFKTAIEIFESIKDIKIYSAEKFFSNKFNIFSFKFALTNSLFSTLTASPKYLLEMIVFITLAIAILIITFNNSISLESIPLLGTFAFAAYKAQPALSNVIYGINSLEYGSKIIDNLYKELSVEKNNYLIKRKRELKSFSETNNYCLITKNLSYLYKDTEGIRNLNFKVDYPSLFIIAGESGSGKSTLLNIISGLQKPQNGKVIFNRRIFNNENPKISYLHQDHSLFDASIAENIAFGIEKENIDYFLIEDALKKVGMLKYIKNLEESFHTKVGEKGSKFSVGQIQRIAIARALYFNPNILILDEPTSALDKDNAESLVKTIYEISKKITVIISTHQLNYFPKNSNVFYLNKN